jgi:hypothetical protein
MFKRNWPLFTAGTLILLIFGYFYYLYVKSPTLNWFVNYKHKSDSPYGSELLYKMISELHPDYTFKTIEEPLTYHYEFNQLKSKNNIYFYQGFSFAPDRSTIGSLSNFLRKGNQVFIAADGVSQFFLDSILHPGKEFNGQQYSNCLPILHCMKYYPGFIHPQLKTGKRYPISYKMMQASFPMEVAYFSEGFISDMGLDSSNQTYYRIGNFKLGDRATNLNYIKIKVGEGWLHLYSTPLILTNYHLRKKEIFSYAGKLFGHLEQGNIYWHVNSYINSDVRQENNETQKSPFSVLLSYKSLRYAWYTFLGALIAFCILGIKRKQRPIPVLEQVKNTSVEFAETISKLYLVAGKHKNIAQQKYRYFFNYIKTRYGIHLKDNKQEDKTRLAYISKMPLDDIEKIMQNYRKIESLPDTTADELHESVVLINDFYFKTGNRRNDG